MPAGVRPKGEACVPGFLGSCNLCLSPHKRAYLCSKCMGETSSPKVSQIRELQGQREQLLQALAASMAEKERGRAQQMVLHLLLEESQVMRQRAAEAKHMLSEVQRRTEEESRGVDGRTQRLKVALQAVSASIWILPYPRSSCAVCQLPPSELMECSADVARHVVYTPQTASWQLPPACPPCTAAECCEG